MALSCRATSEGSVLTRFLRAAPNFLPTDPIRDTRDARVDVLASTTGASVVGGNEDGGVCSRGGVRGLVQGSVRSSSS